jgi:hypothetical protein
MSAKETDSPRRRGPAWDRETINRAKELRRYGESYRAIGLALREPPAPPVSASTVQYWTEDVKVDPSGRWTLAEEASRTSPDPAVVMIELGAVILNSNGRVTGMTRTEAQWVTLISRVRPDLAESGPGSTWHLARRCIEATGKGDEVELAVIERELAEGAAAERWPDLRRDLEDLRARAARSAADIQKGMNPFLDGRPYNPEADR